MNEESCASAQSPAPGPGAGGTVAEVFAAFAWLGLTSFGGPIAHLGYFRAEFVAKRRWLSEGAYADLVGLCQFLPGPASSKLGFSLGLLRAGLPGGIAAWIAFTLPSAALLVAFAYGADPLSRSATGIGMLHGLQLVAVAIVGQAVWGMATSLTPDRTRASIGIVAATIALLAPSAISQIGAIAMGALAGWRFCRADDVTTPEPLASPVRRTAGLVFFFLFALLLLLAFAPLGDGIASMFAAFYRSGALVFGGGHVVLPLLRSAVVEPGWVPADTFLAGYGAAQAVPGPLFTFAAFLGAVGATPRNGAEGAIVALVAIFLPGLLLQLAALPLWSEFRGRKSARAALRGVNAAVVGILLAALYDPVWTSAVHTHGDFVAVLVGELLLLRWKTPPILVVGLTAALGALSAA